MSERPFIPDWFWEIIDSTRPDLLALALRLEQLSRKDLLRYSHFYQVASDAVCHAWEGPFIDDEIGHLSEDSTEDLTDWIVSGGKESWLYATEPDVDLVALFLLSVQAERGEIDEPPQWTLDVTLEDRQGYQTPNGLAIPIFYERHNSNNEDFYEALEKLRAEM